MLDRCGALTETGLQALKQELKQVGSVHSLQIYYGCEPDFVYVIEIWVKIVCEKSVKLDL